MTALEHAIVQAVVLCVLLARDLVPGTRPPKAREQVCAELGRILGLLDPRFDAMWVADPKVYVREFLNSVRPDAHDDFVQKLVEDAHRDHVFATLKYTRKPATADDDVIERLAAEIAQVLGLDVGDPDDVADHAKMMYAAAHMDLIRHG